MSDRLKVIQWATGNIGNEALKAILMHPQMELVGVRVYSDEKDGVDAGQLCEMGETGVFDHDSDGGACCRPFRHHAAKQCETSDGSLDLVAHAETRQ